MDTVHSAITEPVRRLEVFTGAGRRRKRSDEEKARIVAEIVASGDSVCSVARRHGGAAGAHSKSEEVQFVPAVVDAVVPAPALGRIAASPSRPLAPVTSTLFGTICFWAVTFIRLTSFP